MKVAVTSLLLSLWPLLCHTLTGEGGNDLSSTLTEEYVTIAMVTLHAFLGKVGPMVTLLPFPEGK